MKLKLRFGFSIALMTFGLASNKQRVAVWLRLHDGLGGDLLRRGAAVLDNESLTEPLRQHLPGEPRDNVGGAARRKANEEMNRPRRIGVGAGAAQQRRHGDGACGQVEKLSARELHVFL